MGKRLCGQWLEWWLDADIMACLRQGVGSEVPNIIVSDGGEATHAAAKCMIHLERSTTGVHVFLLLFSTSPCVTVEGRG